jgi:hypothetical protein
MIGNSKPLASLSSGLLARKGQARPAMRPQGFLNMGPGAQEDLGWNDMGDDAPKPPVLQQREQLNEQLAAPEPATAPEPEAVAAAPLPEPAPARPVSKGTLARVVREAAAKKGKSAFTLRLDHERHLRLRLASAVTNRSAQQLVTQALDAFLESLAEVEALARQVGPAKDRG